MAVWNSLKLIILLWQLLVLSQANSRNVKMKNLYRMKFERQWQAQGGGGGGNAINDYNAMTAVRHLTTHQRRGQRFFSPFLTIFAWLRNAIELHSTRSEYNPEEEGGGGGEYYCTQNWTRWIANARKINLRKISLTTQYTYPNPIWTKRRKGEHVVRASAQTMHRQWIVQFHAGHHHRVFGPARSLTEDVRNP